MKRQRQGRTPRPQSRRYYHSKTDLYWVEEVMGERALIEDCRTGTLIDVPSWHLQAMTPLAPTRSNDPSAFSAREQAPTR